MAELNAYKTLELAPGATQPEIKKAYRRLAKLYHPDKNSSPNASRKFREITAAYNELTNGKPKPYIRDEGYENAAEIIRQEREKARMRARNVDKERKEREEKFRKSELYDVLLLLQYIGHGLLIVISIGAIVVPVILGIIIEPVVFFASLFFVIIGGFLLWHIYEKRKTWFKLGKFNTTIADLIRKIQKPIPHLSTDKCFYSEGEKADGKSYRINLIRVLDIQVNTFGALNHNARIKSKGKSLIIPRSARAQYVHRICSITKVIIIVGFVLFFPVTSIIWRFLAALVTSGIISVVILRSTKVKGKTSFLFTPSLVIKSCVWFLAILAISSTGPGFDISLSEFKFILFAGLFFLLDMIFDLIFGMFPFYQKLFRPMIPQGKVLNMLYEEGYQNYIEYPVYSILFPLIKWIY